MKSKLIKAVVFILIFFLLLMISSRIVMPKNNSKEAGMHDYEANGIVAEKENTIDLLVLGDSEAFTSISPMEIWNEYGYTSYVCCSTEQSIPESIILLMKALKKQKPKMVILEANTIYKASKREDHLGKLLQYLIPVVEYHDRWKYLNKEDWTGEINYNIVNDFKGYHFTKEVRPAKPGDKMKYTEEVQFIPRTNKIYVKLLKKYCQDNGIYFSIIRTPTTYSWDYKSYNGVKQFTDEEQIEFIDYNIISDKINIDWDHDSKDGGDHLNHYGALKTTKFFAKYLNEKNILTDHRNEEKYKEWHDSYSNYKRIVETD